jgi:hypothetical protein
METEQWVCDTCADAIVDPHGALVTWTTDADNRARAFRFVHKGRACDTERSAFTWQLSDALGVDGQAWWFSLLTYGPMFDGQKAGVADMDEFVDAFRRAQLPGYEAARPYFRAEIVHDNYGDANEVAVYQRGALMDIAELGRRE